MRRLNLVLPGLFVAMGVLIFLQGRLLVKSAGEKSSSQNSLPQTVQARLNGMSMIIMTYLQNHDALALGNIQSEGDQAQALLMEVHQKALQEGDSSSYGQIVKAYEDMRAATLSLLSRDHERMKSRELLNSSSEALISILIARIEPSIKPSQVNAAMRLQAVLAASEEAKAFTQNAERMTDLEGSQKRFDMAVDTYARLSRTNRANNWAREAKGLFDQCFIQARDLQRLYQETQAALARYTQRRDVLDVVFQESRAIHSAGAPLRTVRQVVTSGVVYSGLAGLLLILTGALLVRSGRRNENVNVKPLDDILLCVEAAATGDVSRLPARDSSDNFGRLAAAVRRLIKVLARSENLVYHLAALVDSSGEAIISHTLEGKILSWNKGAQRIYGYSAEEMKDQSISKLASDDGGGILMSYLQKIRRGERVQPFETTHLASNGRSVRALVRMSAILDSTRQVIGASFCAQELPAPFLIPPKIVHENKLN